MKDAHANIDTDLFVIFGIELQVDFNYYKGRPAKLYGEPADCYPEEYPEVEIQKVSVLNDNQSGITDITELLSLNAINTLQDMIIVRAHENHQQEP